VVAVTGNAFDSFNSFNSFDSFHIAAVGVVAVTGNAFDGFNSFDSFHIAAVGVVAVTGNAFDGFNSCHKTAVGMVAVADSAVAGWTANIYAVTVVFATGAEATSGNGAFNGAKAVGGVVAFIIRAEVMGAIAGLAFDSFHCRYKSAVFMVAAAFNAFDAFDAFHCRYKSAVGMVAAAFNAFDAFDAFDAFYCRYKSAVGMVAAAFNAFDSFYGRYGGLAFAGVTANYGGVDGRVDGADRRLPFEADDRQDECQDCDDRDDKMFHALTQPFLVNKFTSVDAATIIPYDPKDVKQ